MQTIYRQGRNFSVSTDRYEQSKMDTTEELMAEAVRKYDNVYFIRPDTGKYGKESSVDGIHPSDMGYLGWEESIRKPIMKILKRYDIK